MQFSRKDGLDEAAVQALIDAAVSPEVLPVRLLNWTTADIPSTSTDGTEDTLLSMPVAAGTFEFNGQRIVASFSMRTVASATASRRILLYINGTGSPALIWDSGVISGAGVLSGGTLYFQVTIVRNSNGAAICFVAVDTTITSVIPKATHALIAADIDWNNSSQAILVDAIASGTGAAPGDITLLGGLGVTLWLNDGGGSLNP